MLTSYARSAAEIEAIDLAAACLLAEADRQFAETCHTMMFSHAAGFTGETEIQSGDIFSRATLGNLFAEIAHIGREFPWSADFNAIARREAGYIAGAKLRDRSGGWSYFPNLPELPPDADSLAAALSLFVQAAPEHVTLCRDAVAHILAGVQEDGSFETWIVCTADRPEDRARMQWAIATFWGSGVDPDVLAHFYYSLWMLDSARYKRAIARGASRVIEMQQPDGSWRATWYTGQAYGTALATRLLHALNLGALAQKRAREFVLGSQHEDGTWGDGASVPLETARNLSTLRQTETTTETVEIKRAVVALHDLQRADGSWCASPWIRMEIGRASGTILNTITYQSSTITTAFCLRALLG